MIKPSQAQLDYLSEFFFEFFLPALVSVATLLLLVFLFVYAAYTVDRQSDFDKADTFIQECRESERYTMDECVTLLEASE